MGRAAVANGTGAIDPQVVRAAANRCKALELVVLLAEKGNIC